MNRPMVRACGSLRTIVLAGLVACGGLQVEPTMRLDETARNILEALHSSDPGTQQNAVLRLETVSDASWIQILCELTRDKSQPLRMLAAEQAGRRPLPEAWAVLIVLTGDPEPGVRNAANAILRGLRKKHARDH